MKRWPRRIRQQVEYAAVRAVLLLSAFLPIGLARGVGALAGGLAFALGVRRAVSVENIRSALGVTPAEASRIAARSYRNLGRSLVEFAAFGRWSSADVLRQVEFEGMEHLERARAQGRGTVCVAGHFGNWELLGAAVVARGYRVSFLVGEQTNGRVDTVMNDLRRAQGIGIITRATALRKVLQALKANEIVALLADQDARRGGVMVDFLGRPASTVRGPALFSIRSGSPLIPIFIHRESGRHRIWVEPPLCPDPSLDEDAAVLDLTRRHAEVLARYVRRHPEEYFWAHRRWKTKSV